MAGFDLLAMADLLIDGDNNWLYEMNLCIGGVYWRDEPDNDLFCRGDDDSDRGGADCHRTY